MSTDRPGPGKGPKKGALPQRSKGQGSRPSASNKSSAQSTTKQARYAERQARKQEALRSARRRRDQRFAIAIIALVVVVVGVLVIVKVTGGGTGTSADQPSPARGTPVAAATMAKISSVSLRTLNSAPNSALVTPIQQASGSPLDTPIRSDGKPELLFIGAEFCPYCAAERWPIYIALSKFGTFSPSPGRIHSANEDGDVPTLTFYGTKYTSPYFSFNPVEVTTNHPAPGGGYTPLQSPTAAEESIWNAGNGGGFPFLDFGGKQILTSSQYSFTDMEDLPFSAVAAQVGNNSTEIGAGIDASASELIKTICNSLTHDQPSSVCSP